jgi:hypothetical protein
VKPTAIASGRLVDTDGKVISDRKLTCGIRVPLGLGREAAFCWAFGNTTTTDPNGLFQLTGLVLGEKYEIHVSAAKGTRGFTIKTKVVATTPGRIALGDVPVDQRPRAAYVPPTAAQRARESFSERKEKSPRERLDDLLSEAKREYTRPLILFGTPRDPACIDLFRLFAESSGGKGAGNSKPASTSPSDLRWEFELCSLDAANAEMRALAAALGMPLAKGAAPRLAVLSDEGRVTASYPLQFGDGKKLDSRALAKFLLKHKLPTRDAEAMLANGLATAKSENKRVFLILSGSPCVPCRMLARFLAANKAELERHYVFVKLDVGRDTHADSVRERYESKSDINGIPWYVILDGAGKPLITSNAKELADGGPTNIGFPGSKEGIDHLMKMLRQTAPGLSGGALAHLRRELEKKP